MSDPLGDSKPIAPPGWRKDLVEAARPFRAIQTIPSPS